MAARKFQDGDKVKFKSKYGEETYPGPWVIKQYTSPNGWDAKQYFLKFAPDATVEDKKANKYGCPVAGFSAGQLQTAIDVPEFTSPEMALAWFDGEDFQEPMLASEFAKVK